MTGVELGKKVTGRDAKKKYLETGRFNVISFRIISRILRGIGNAQIQVALEFTTRKALKKGTRLQINVSPIRGKRYSVERMLESATGAHKYLCSEAP